MELIVRVLACLAAGLGIRATARGFEVTPNTVLPRLVEAAEQLTAFTSYCLCEVHVQQLQLDERYAVLSAVKDGEILSVATCRANTCATSWPDSTITAPVSAYRRASYTVRYSRFNRVHVIRS